MPPRHVYWTIIYGNQATSFRAATPEELLPTLKQLQSRHPDAVLKYFARGRLWNSAEEARPRRNERGRDRREPAGQPQRRGQDTERRGKDWRPGGQHKDPRDRWKVPRDVKRKRFAQRLRQTGAGGPREHREKPERPGNDRGRPRPADRYRRRPHERPPKKDPEE